MADLRIPDINKVQVAGNLTRDPELKYLPSGMALCEFSVAVNRKYKTKSGETREESLYVDVTVWGNTAEWVGTKMQKGQPVYVEGRLKQDSWDDKATGQKRSKLCVTGERVQPLTWDGESNQAHAGGGRQQPDTRRPAPRPIEEPIPEDDLPF